MPNDDTFFLTQMWQTDDLKAELETLREKLRGKSARYHALTLRLDEAMNRLSKMEEKADFVITQLAQIEALLTPPPPSAAEKLSGDLEQYVHLPALMTSGALAGAGLVALVYAGVGPKLLTAIGKAPKLGRAAKLAKATSFTKAAKFAKVTVVLGIAVSIIDVVVQMTSANKINAQLRKDRQKLRKAIAEADTLLAEMAANAAEAEAIVRTLLTDAGLGDLDTDAGITRYVEEMNQAIAGLGKQKAVARMVRRMAMLGLTPDMIAGTSQLDPAQVADMIRRLSIERALVAGRATEAIAAEFAVEAGQVEAIAALVRARGDALAGDPLEAIHTATGVSAAVIEGEIDENILRAAPHWAVIEAGDTLAALADPLLVHEEALSRVHRELTLKSALIAWEGADLPPDAKTVAPEVLADWQEDLRTARTRIDESAATGPIDRPAELAVSLRVPLGFIG